MKLTKDKDYLRNQDKEKVNYFHSSSIINDHIVNKTSTIKGNLFKNTSRSIKLLSNDHLSKCNSKNINFNYNEKDYENIVNSDFINNKMENFNNDLNFNNNNINNSNGKYNSLNCNDNANKLNCNFDNKSVEQNLDKDTKPEITPGIISFS